MENELSGLRVAFLTTHAGLATSEGMEQMELTAPRQAPVPHDADPAYYGAVVVRGGVTDADLLRTASAAVSSVREFLDMDEPGRRVLVEADVVRGSTRTSYPTLRSDIENAGGNWMGTSGHRPGDHPALWAALTKVFSRRSQAA
jgi:protease I